MNIEQVTFTVFSRGSSEPIAVNMFLHTEDVSRFGLMNETYRNGIADSKNASISLRYIIV